LFLMWCTAASRRALARGWGARCPHRPPVRHMGSMFPGGVPLAAPDAILSLTDMYNKDTHPNKVNVGVGAYRDDSGKFVVLPSVLEAVRRVSSRVHTSGLEYTPIAGDPRYLTLATQFAYGAQCPAMAEGRVAALQGLSGTGSLRIGFDVLKRFHGDVDTVLVPNPTWGNHNSIIKASGLNVESYRYLKPDRVSFDFDGMAADLDKAKAGTVVLLHACAHNPTGVDPSLDQWLQLSELIKRKGHVPFFDCAYQGFATGDADRDAAAIRLFVREGHRLLLAQSFAKNFGLYGERIGAISFVMESPDAAANVLSQAKLVARATYSSPPINGARIVTEVLGDPVLRQQWTGDCKHMAQRIASMRKALRQALEAHGAQSWAHIESQVGMFAFSGLSQEQVLRLRQDFHVYMTLDGRISMAGVTSGNVGYLADSVHRAVVGK